MNDTFFALDEKRGDAQEAHQFADACNERLRELAGIRAALNAARKTGDARKVAALADELADELEISRLAFDADCF